MLSKRSSIIVDKLITLAISPILVFSSVGSSSTNPCGVMLNMVKDFLGLTASAKCTLSRIKYVDRKFHAIQGNWQNEQRAFRKVH